MRCYEIEICCDTCPYFPTCDEEEDFVDRMLEMNYEEFNDIAPWGQDDVDA